jgi:hypothetical protein
LTNSTTRVDIKFADFSDAFHYAVDLTGDNHVDLYTKIGMDKSQWSKIYNGEIKKPQRTTRNKLNEVVGNTIKQIQGGWSVIQPESAQNIESLIDSNVASSDNAESVFQRLDAFSKDVRPLLKLYDEAKNDKGFNEETLKQFALGIEARLYRAFNHLK